GRSRGPSGPAALTCPTASYGRSRRLSRAGATFSRIFSTRRPNPFVRIVGSDSGTGGRRRRGIPGSSTRGGGSVEYVEEDARLSRLTTEWNLIFLTQTGTPEEAGRAASQLICRYAGAVHRYFLKALGDPD